MAPLVARGDLVFLASDDRLLFINVSDASVVEKSLVREGRINTQSKPVTKMNTDYDLTRVIAGTCLALSSCGLMVAACTLDKDLTVWDVNSRELLHQWEAPRKVSALTFSKNGCHLIVADKAGDCYSYALSPPCTKGLLIVGHLSMLLDVVVTDKMVITCERDEKIRVSHFPNGYNINNFCLGHTEFVTCIALVSDDLLLSGSGDGTVRLWEYKTGTQLCTHNLRSPEDRDMDMAVRSVTLCRLDDTTTMATVLVNKSRTLLTFKIHQRTLTLDQQIQLDSFPLSAAFRDSHCLYVLTDHESGPMKCLQSTDDGPFVELQEKVQFLNEQHIKPIKDCVDACNGDLKPLYKRWFDNMQDYRSRKEDRLDGRGKQRPANGGNCCPSDGKKARVE